MRVALLAYVLATMAAVFVWPTWRLCRRERIRAWVLPRDDSAAGVVAAWFRVTMAALLALAVAIAAGVPLAALGPLTWLSHPPAAVAGWALMTVALAWIAIAQSQMGRSWRIGIDEGARAALVRHGLFGRSRNPIFLGMRVALAGLFLALPNAISLGILLLTEALIQVQVRLEEKHLRAELGDRYGDYAREVPRWL